MGEMFGAQAVACVRLGFRCILATMLLCSPTRAGEANATPDGASWGAVTSDLFGAFFGTPDTSLLNTFKQSQVQELCKPHVMPLPRLSLAEGVACDDSNVRLRTDGTLIYRKAKKPDAIMNYCVEGKEGETAILVFNVPGSRDKRCYEVEYAKAFLTDTLPNSDQSFATVQVLRARQADKDVLRAARTALIKPLNDALVAEVLAQAIRELKKGSRSGAPPQLMSSDELLEQALNGVKARTLSGGSPGNFCPSEPSVPASAKSCVGKLLDRLVLPSNGEPGRLRSEFQKVFDPSISQALPYPEDGPACGRIQDLVFNDEKTTRQVVARALLANGGYQLEYEGQWAVKHNSDTVILPLYHGIKQAELKAFGDHRTETGKLLFWAINTSHKNKDLLTVVADGTVAGNQKLDVVVELLVKILIKAGDLQKLGPGPVPLDVCSNILASKLNWERDDANVELELIPSSDSTSLVVEQWTKPGEKYKAYICTGECPKPEEVDAETTFRKVTVKSLHNWWGLAFEMAFSPTLGNLGRRYEWDRVSGQGEDTLWRLSVQSRGPVVWTSNVLLTFYPGRNEWGFGFGPTVLRNGVAELGKQWNARVMYEMSPGLLITVGGNVGTNDALSYASEGDLAVQASAPPAPDTGNEYAAGMSVGLGLDFAFFEEAIKEFTE